jgi:hypothetical protein
LLARGKVQDVPPLPAVPPWRATDKVELPSPEQLGVAPAPAAPCPGAAASTVDWNATHAQLRRLGAVGWQLGRLPQGGYRFTFLLPTGEPNHSRHYEGIGATEADAVRLALTGAGQSGPGR